MKLPTFGNIIRGARLGFHWNPRLEAMVRISVMSLGIKVLMCPPDCIPAKVDPEHYSAWWESAQDVCSMSRAISAHAKPDRSVWFFVDDNGEEVEI
jgi:hypothetical protein